MDLVARDAVAPPDFVARAARVLPDPAADTEPFRRAAPVLAVPLVFAAPLVFAVPFVLAVPLVVAFAVPLPLALFARPVAALVPASKRGGPLRPRGRRNQFPV